MVCTKNVEKRQTVISLLQEGLTQVEVGRRLGLTRQRIRQLAEDSWESIIAPPNGYMTPDQAAKQMGWGRMVDDSVDLCVVFTVLNNCPEVKVKVTFRYSVQFNSVTSHTQRSRNTSFW